MCTQCLVNPFYYGEVMPGWFLIRARRASSDMDVKDWGLVECNDPSIVFSTTPYIPASGFSVAEIEKFSDELVCDPSTGYRLIAAFKQVKPIFRVLRLYSKHMAFRLEDRLFLYLADYIKNSTPETDSDPFPQLDNESTIAHDYTFDPKEP